MNRVDRNHDSFFAAAKNLQFEDDTELSLKANKSTMNESDFFGKMNSAKQEAKIKNSNISEY